jgi:predicted DNA binding protein
MLEAILSIQTPIDWKQEILQKYHAKMDVMDCRPLDDGGCTNLVAIEVEPQHVDMALKDIKDNPDVETVDLNTHPEGTMKGVVKTSKCLGCCATAGKETFVMDVGMNANGNVVQRVITTDKESVRQVIGILEGHGHTVTLDKLTTWDPSEPLTTRQEDLLHIAYERGYFDQPKKIDLRELSALFGISISTTSEILRKAQHKVLDEYFHTGK